MKIFDFYKMGASPEAVQMIRDTYNVELYAALQACSIGQGSNVVVPYAAGGNDKYAAIVMPRMHGDLCDV